jgi:hypothetical protein
VVPQPPQFWLSVWVLTQDPLHDVCPELQVIEPVPVAGFAHPAANTANPTAATKAKRDE